ncbi:MAG: TonB-dependent receptor [Cytophagales bacterium]|jgi:hypothetical protein|nr:TonB-dependent receptor [Bacteroidota bacterium]MBS1981534.1 TonB-dependent receptor [Bacteroidota bacterium]WHZ08530.1 MAG: TonB-dependent receptor [Cytophagales bacterium]
MRIVFFFCLFLTSYCIAQQKFTLSGYVKDASNGEAMIGATVFVQPVNAGTSTNEYGFYSLTLPAGTYTVKYNYLGYKLVTEEITLDKNLPTDVELVSEATVLKEIQVVEESDRPTAQNPGMSMNKMNVSVMKKIPAFLGEVDVIRSILLLPGVSTVGEGAAGFNVRGGSVGQNLVYLDEAPVYNSSHLLGFFSVFNPDAVKDITLYKGAVPSRFGGRLASVLDVRMKEGNNKKTEIHGGIGTVFSRFSIEGPLVKNKSSFIVAARRSYIDILARPFVSVLKNGGALNFYDLTLKTNYNFNDKNKVYLSGYFGRDNFLFDKNQGFSWGNATGTLRWNHLFNDKLFLNQALVFSKYDYSLQFGGTEQNNFKWKSSISNFIYRPDFSYFINSNHEVNFGGEAIYYTFVPANATGTTNGTPVDVSLEKKYNSEISLYASHALKINPRVSIDYGLRYSSFSLYGPGTQYLYNDTVPGIRKRVIGEKTYSKREAIQTYGNWQPRFSFKYQLNENSSIKGSYNRMVQYLHLISNTTASNPLDVWTPSTANIKPELGDQLTTGYFRTLTTPTAQYEFSVEGYLRYTQNQIDYINGADILINRYLEGDLLSGKGRAYGVEFFAQKKTGRLNGWISYTLGRTELQVIGINNDNWYPTRYNQTHNLKVVGFYEINKRWSFSTNFIYTSGTPTTFPNSRYTQQGILIPYLATNARNNVTLPSYNRLDIAFTLQGKEADKSGRKRKNKDYWVFSIYNLYARQNPFSIYFSQVNDQTLPGQPLLSQAKQISIIGTFVPAISYNLKF